MTSPVKGATFRDRRQVTSGPDVSLPPTSGPDLF